ncbi:hypothetical protein C8R45DRAFT_1020346 [Mycena sanguinolenta]|nr:hypothetical protein C8R45DRAFT_1020346 [Mycena sanguinolenta]
MRDLPQPTDQPKIEGCPVIELHDSLEDVKHLLDALYNPHIFNKQALPFPLIAAMVRMGRKYDFKNLLEAAMQRLTQEHPTTLESFGDIRADIPRYTPHAIVEQPGLMFDMLTLARENNLFALLPCAYFRIVFFHNQMEIFDGIPSKKDCPPVTLFIQDQRVCILAIQKISRAQWDHDGFARWMGSATLSLNCTDENVCAVLKPRIFSKLARLRVSFAPISGKWLCDSCMCQHREVMAETRKKMWEDLPSYFDLPPWDELKNDI